MGLQKIKILYDYDIQHMLYDDCEPVSMYKQYLNVVEKWQMGWCAEFIRGGVIIDINSHLGNTSVFYAKHCNPNMVISITDDIDNHIATVSNSVENYCSCIVPVYASTIQGQDNYRTVDDIYLGIRCKLIKVSSSDPIQTLNGAIKTIEASRPNIIVDIPKDEYTELNKQIKEFGYRAVKTNEYGTTLYTSSNTALYKQHSV